MFRYYKGEAENPFDNARQNAACMFWFYESVFQDQFNSNESSDWYAFFIDHGLGDQFMKLITEKDYERPSEKIKGAVFYLWLEYLFTFKLYPEWGAKVNDYKELYYADNVMSQNNEVNLTGEQLFDFYTGIDNEYKSVLFQAHTEIGDDLFKLLEEAEKAGKKIVIKEDIPEAIDSPLTIAIE